MNWKYIYYSMDFSWLEHQDPAPCICPLTIHHRHHHHHYQQQQHRQFSKKRQWSVIQNKALPSCTKKNKYKKEKSQQKNYTLRLLCSVYTVHLSNGWLLCVSVACVCSVHSITIHWKCCSLSILNRITFYVETNKIICYDGVVVGGFWWLQIWNLVTFEYISCCGHKETDENRFNFAFWNQYIYA